MTQQPDWLCDIEFPESPIPTGTTRRIDEVTVKRDGQIWRIHKSDTDPFPSNPHAHNVESGLKLDLSSGELFLGREPTGTRISRKKLDFIRRELASKGIVPPALAI